MEAHDQITEQFREAVRKSETGDFPGMEAVWERVTTQLDKDEPQKRSAFPFYKIGIAAAILILLGAGAVMLMQLGRQAESPSVAKQKVMPQPATLPATTITDLKDTTAALVQQVSPVSSLNKKPGTRNKLAPVVPSSIVAAPVAVPGTPVYRVKGLITDGQGQPIPGATVHISGTRYTTVSDEDGMYELEVKGNKELSISAAGYLTSEVSARPGRLLTTLQENLVAQNETESAGPYRSYVTEDKYRGADRVVAKQLEQMPASSITRAIEGAAPGIQVTHGGGQPGSGGHIRMRGTGSLPDQGSNVRERVYPKEITGDELIRAIEAAAPGIQITRGGGQPGRAGTRFGCSTGANASPALYVLDGIPYTGDITLIDRSTIERITLLKQSKATALYGSRGANGVIMITTKNGKAQKQKAGFFQRIKRLFRKKQVAGITMQEQLPEVNKGETYNPYVENPFASPAAQPLSTFSIDVDNAAYTNIRRLINNGAAVPADAVRIEEMINFFDYHYPQPQGSHPFSITTDYSAAPWNKEHQLLRIGLQGKSILPEHLPASNLVFLVDVSGSMDEPNKLPLLKASMKLLIRQLRKQDHVAIVVYAGAAGLVLPSTPGDRKAEISAALDQLQAGGSTAGGAGIELAYKIAQEHFIKDGNNRVILATDGDFNVGASSDADMQTLIEQKRKSNIFLTCLGYGMGNYKDSKMEVLADKGNGNYAYIDNLQEANRFLVKEFSGTLYSIAKDVKIQVGFNPRYVQAYRLIGYENRMLRTEDFVNDAIDAGELGSGHRVTALYEIIPAGVHSTFAPAAAPAKDEVAKQDEAPFGDELAQVKFRYKQPDGDKSIEMKQSIAYTPLSLEQADPDFKLAAAVAWFGLKLRHSKLVQDTARDAIVKLAKAASAADSQGYKAEFVRLVETVQ